ncbi:MAG: hypothetical protein JNM76_00375 [Betaproteobacteria bacterium]|nr:hypothetical protein [Betaproteobacteria bacterium]
MNRLTHDLRKAAAACVIGAALWHPPAQASDANHPVNFSDIWWNAAESGWATYVAHHGDTAGFGLLVHDAEGRPFHVTGGLRLIARTNPGFHPVFGGTLIATTGPGFGGVFDPVQVTRRVVGAATFEPLSANTARLSYSIDGVTVIKTVSRMTIDTPDIGGVYRHVQRLDFQAGTPGMAPRNYDAGVLTVDHQGASVSMRFDGEKSRCDYQGQYAQNGRYGEITGVYGCDGGGGGAFRMTEVERSASGLSGKFSTLQGATGFVRGNFSALPGN